jgi:signal peptidase II
MKRAALIVFIVLLIDQFVKIWIKTHMSLGEQISVIENFFYIHFTENNGMAFGLELEGEYGKLILSLFRILAVFGIGWYLVILVKQKAHRGLISSISLIMAGAIGNILDSAFYGLIFDKGTTSQGEYYSDIAQFSSNGYASFLHGSVVDMFYFNTHLEHVFWKSGPFNFSFPIFNISDSAITIGVFIILIFQRRFFKHEKKEEVQITDSPGSTDEKENSSSSESENL